MNAALRERLSRLQEGSHTPLSPWRRATQITNSFLYWLPVSCFPIPLEQKHWILALLEKLMKHGEKAGLRSEVFIQLTTINSYPSLKDTFLKTSFEYRPVLGLTLQPGVSLPTPPTLENMQPVIQGKKKFDLDEYMSPYCCWFLDKAGEKQRELFFGFGGMTIICLEPDSNSKLPKMPELGNILKHPAFNAITSRFNVARALESASSLADAFAAKSKSLFGAHLENDPQFPGIIFVLPSLAATQFLNFTDEEAQKHFQLFSIYVTESPADNGILLASKDDIDSILVQFVQELNDDGMAYPLK